MGDLEGLEGDLELNLEDLEGGNGGSWEGVLEVSRITVLAAEASPPTFRVLVRQNSLPF